MTSSSRCHLKLETFPISSTCIITRLENFGMKRFQKYRSRQTCHRSPFTARRTVDAMETVPRTAIEDASFGMCFDEPCEADKPNPISSCNKSRQVNSFQRIYQVAPVDTLDLPALFSRNGAVTSKTLQKLFTWRDLGFARRSAAHLTLLPPAPPVALQCH